MKNYKQLIFGLVIGIIAGVFLGPNIASAIGSGVGVIDLEKAVYAHPNYETKKAAFDAFKQQQDALLDSYRNKATLTNEDKEAIVNLRVQIDKAVSDKYDELFKPLEDEVIQAVNKVGMESGIEVIIDSKAVLYGGLDLTGVVVNKLGGKL
jgi:Skp family chaperone for outer membrane proteins